MKLNCIIQLGYDKTYSLLADDKLIYHTPFRGVNELCDSLYRLDIDSIKIFAQGTPVPQVPEQAYCISNLIIRDTCLSLVLVQKDIMTLISLASFLGVKDVKVYSYSDFILNKFKNEKRVILVDNYQQGYIVIVVRDGKILEYRTCSKNNCSRIISVMKTQYDFPVKPVKGIVDIINISMHIKNYRRISKSQLADLEHIPFCFTFKGKEITRPAEPLDKEAWVSDVESTKEIPKSLIDDEMNGDNEIAETYEDDDMWDGFPRGARVKQDRRAFNIRNLPKTATQEEKLDNKEIDFSFGQKTNDRLMDIIVTITLLVVVSLTVLGLVVTFSYKSKSNKLLKEINICQERLKVTSSISQNLSNDKDQMEPVSNIYSLLTGSSINSMEYKNGGYFVTVGYKNSEELNKYRELLSSKFNVSGETNINGDDTSKKLTRFTIKV